MRFLGLYYYAHGDTLKGMDVWLGVMREQLQWRSAHTPAKECISFSFIALFVVTRLAERTDQFVLS